MPLYGCLFTLSESGEVIRTTDVLEVGAETTSRQDAQRLLDAVDRADHQLVLQNPTIMVRAEADQRPVMLGFGIKAEAGGLMLDAVDGA